MMSRDFDPNAAATEDSGIFGLPEDEARSKLVLIPVPWEVTTSYGGGTSLAPSAILEASKQVDLFDLDVEKPYECGVYMQRISTEIQAWNQTGKSLARKIIEVGGDLSRDSTLSQALAQVNQLSERLNEWVYQETCRLLREEKIVGLVGGDHSTPFGCIRAHAEKFSRSVIGEKTDFGILHFDAHSDTREAYEGFVHSHASIMYNVLERIPEVTRLVQVGIRDVCEQEILYCRSQDDRVRIYFDRELSRHRFEGKSFDFLASQIVSDLPELVYVSFDIDGLDPKYCPNTGTPVPGGLAYNEAIHVLREVVKSGRRIVGFDLNEVSPGEAQQGQWDANCGARLLYKLIGFALASHGHCQLMLD